MPVIRHIGIRDSIGQILLKPTPMRLLHSTRPKQHEMIFFYTRNSQITIEFAFWRQHGRKRQSAGLWDETSEEMIKVFTAACAFKFVFGEIGNFDTTHRFTDNFDFFANVIV